MTFTLRLNRELVEKAIRLALKNHFAFKFIRFMVYLSAFGLVFTLISIPILGNTEFGMQTAAQMLMIMGFFGFLGFLTPKWVAKRAMAQTEMQMEHHWVLDDTGFHISTELSNGMRKWPTVVKLQENEELMLIFISSRIYHLLPKNQVTDDILAQVRSYCEQKV